MTKAIKFDSQGVFLDLTNDEIKFASLNNSDCHILFYVMQKHQ